MTAYNKLVRDRIPEIIRANGGNPVISVLDNGEFRDALQAKLREEVDEYLESPSVEELADIVEILRALASLDGSSWEYVEKVREHKAQERGGFQQRIFLSSTHR